MILKILIAGCVIFSFAYIALNWNPANKCEYDVEKCKNCPFKCDKNKGE